MIKFALEKRLAKSKYAVTQVCWIIIMNDRSAILFFDASRLICTNLWDNKLIKTLAKDEVRKEIAGV